MAGTVQDQRTLHRLQQGLRGSTGNVQECPHAPVVGAVPMGRGRCNRGGRKDE